MINPPGDPVPQAPFDVVGEAPGGPDQVVGKRGALLAQDLDDLGGGADAGGLGLGGARAACSNQARSPRKTTSMGVALDGPAGGSGRQGGEGGRGAA